MFEKDGFGHNMGRLAGAVGVGQAWVAGIIFESRGCAASVVDNAG